MLVRTRCDGMDGGAAKAMVWSALGFGACRASYLFIFRVLNSGLFAQAEGLMVYWAAAVFSFVALLLFGREAHDGASPDWVRRTVLPLGAASACAGMVGMVAGEALGVVGVALLGIALAGVGYASCLVLWCVRFSLLPGRAVGIGVTLGMAFSGVALFAVNSIGDWAMPAAAAMGAVAYAGLLPRFAVGDVRPGRSEDVSAEHAGASALQRVIASREFDAGRSFARALVAAFAFPFAYHLAVMTFVSTTIMNRDIEGVLVAVAALLAVVALPRAKPLTVVRFALPLIIAAYLFVGFVPGGAQDALVILAGSGLKFGMIFTLIAFVGFAARRPAYRWQVICLGSCSMYAGRLAALFVARAVSGAAWYDPRLVEYALVVFLVAIVVLTLPVGGEHPVRAAASTDGADKRDDGELRQMGVSVWCAETASAFGLTPREAQILPLIAQGRNRAVIAQRLSITEGTAHVHIAHIYQKLGVHGQQELISLMESATGESAASSAASATPD